MRETVLSIARQIPLFQDVSPECISVEQLGGQTNRNFKLTIAGRSYVMRVAGTGTELIINRRSDEVNSIIAAEIGVGSNVLYCDRASGVMVREFVDGVTLVNEDFRNADVIARAARSLHKFHSSGRTFESRFSILEKLDEYEQLVEKTGGPVPLEYFEVARQAESARRAISALPVHLAPCHNDLVAANFLDTGDELLVLDWEYSGMNDPIFDLAALSAEAYFSPDEEALLLREHSGQNPSEENACRLTLYRALWNQWVTLWSMVQIANNNMNDDFWQFGISHFKAFRDQIADPLFEKKVSTVLLSEQRCAKETSAS